MSKKCVAFSKSKLGLEKPDNKKAFYAGWDAALREALAAPVRIKDLTDDEIEATLGISYNKWEHEWMVRAVIAADREKNK